MKRILNKEFLGYYNIISQKFNYEKVFRKTTDKKKGNEWTWRSI